MDAVLAFLPIFDGEGDHEAKLHGGGVNSEGRNTPPPSFGWSPSPSKLGEER
jgi:hypothetical protein